MAPQTMTGRPSPQHATQQLPGPSLPAEDLLTIIRSLPDVIFRCEKRGDGKIYWTLNEGKLAEEFHLTTKEIEGRSLEELFPGGASPELKDHFERAFQGEAHEFVNEMGGRFFKHYPQPVFDDDGNVVAVVGFISEVTNLTRAQQEIQKLTAELARRVIDLAQANQDLEAFNYTLSHDLRTPLSVIATQCHLIERAAVNEDPGDVQTRIRKVRSSSQQMADLIESVLGLSRASREPIQKQQVDLSALAITILDDLQTTQPERRVALDVSDQVTAWGDPKLLHQVLSNLLGNAWKYTEKTADATIRFGDRMDGGQHVYHVGDNGAGFDMAHAGRLFEPFKRLPGAQGFKGTGIGLATVRKIIERHHGRIWAEARPGQGATFYFTLGEGRDDARDGPHPTKPSM